MSGCHQMRSSENKWSSFSTCPKVPSITQSTASKAATHTHTHTRNQQHQRQQHTRTHAHTHPFNSPFSRTTQVSQYQKGKTNLDFTEARDSEWHWHQLGHMQVCTLFLTTTPAPHRSVFTGQMTFLPPNQQCQSTKGSSKQQIIIIRIQTSGTKLSRRSRSSSCSFIEMPRTGPFWMRFIKCVTNLTQQSAGTSRVQNDTRFYRQICWHKSFQSFIYVHPISNHSTTLSLAVSTVPLGSSTCHSQKNLTLQINLADCSKGEWLFDNDSICAIFLFLLLCLSALTMLVGRQKEHPACKNWVMTDEVLVWLSVCSEMQIVCMWSSRWQCIPKPHPDWFYLSSTGLPRLSWKRGH